MAPVWAGNMGAPHPSSPPCAPADSGTLAGVTRRLCIDDLLSIAVPEAPALSPDGSQVVYVLRTQNEEEDRPERALWRVSTAGGEPRQLTRGPADAAPAWSPDGSRIAFLRKHEDAAQLFLLAADGGEPEQLTHLPLGAGAPHFSPDGTRIAFSAPVDPLAAGGEDAEARNRRLLEPIVTERLDYQWDGSGLLRTPRAQLHVVDLESRDCRQLTFGDANAGDPAWSPDGRRLAFSAAAAPDSDLTLRATPFVIDAGGGASSPEPAGLTDGFAGTVTWTPDGSALLVAGTLGPPVGHTRLLRVPLDGGPVADLAGALDRNVMTGGPAYPGAHPQVTGDGQTVLFCIRDRGCTHLYAVPLAGGEPRPVVTGEDVVVSGVSLVGTRAALVRATARSFGEVALVDVAGGEPTLLAEHPLEDVEPFVRTSREFTISDGTVVHAWLVADPDAPRPAPLLLDVHGGPHNSWNGAADEVHLYHQELAARGWCVLMPNPRGSDGYGQDFWNAALAAWGQADAPDFLEPIDQLVAEGTADPGRLAITGYSYGGFTTCFLTSRDGRFRAAAAGGVVADLRSMAGTSDAGHFLSEHELGGRFWDQPGFEALSPLSQIDQVRTPTLIYHGTADVRCPLGQAQQWHTALRERGVTSELVLYPESSHLFPFDGRPSHRLDYNRRVRDWVDEHAGMASPRARVDRARWERRLQTLAERHRVPGATLGILRVRPGRDDELVVAASGVLNKDTGVESTADSVFQIGSITKVWTATLALQLVDEGKLDLDAPVQRVLPELRLSDAEAAGAVTLRHLLTHTSGIDGDVFTDTGRGDDCLERYVERLAGAAQNHPLGATWSYCNSGFSLAGRVIEKLTGGTWDAALRTRLIEPLGLEHTGTLPEDALRHRAAMGHVAEGGAEPAPAHAWGLPRCAGPAGVIWASAADVLAFARLHLSGGLAPDGSRLLSESSAAEMAALQAELPDRFTLGDSWGLGWIRYEWDGRRLIGHDGNTIGQSAFLRVVPDEGLAITLLTNGGNARDLYEELFRELLAELADLDMPHALAAPDGPVTVDVTPFLGTYERAGARIDVLNGDGGARLRLTATGSLAELTEEPVRELPLVAVTDRLFVVREEHEQTWTPVTFYELDGGRRYVHFGGRATPRVG
jgi:dipeptidyl aminopeptidase/acylaminoacyl peptidase